MTRRSHPHFPALRRACVAGNLDRTHAAGDHYHPAGPVRHPITAPGTVPADAHTPPEADMTTTPDDPQTSPGPEATRRGRGRRPTEEVRHGILQAAGGILLTEGMVAFTIERVAQIAGASKTTIYKWWPSKGALALDGYMHAVKETLAFPDTGDITTDLTTQLHAFVNLLTRTPAGRVLAELIGQAQTDPDLATAYSELYSLGRRQLGAGVIERAQQRGQIRPDTDAQVVVDQLWGACYHRLLIPDEPLTEEFTDALITNLMHGLRPTTQQSEVEPTTPARRTRRPRAHVRGPEATA
jgi:AcrR family transcriptional regulator